jgi:hypothetical protein
MIGDARVRHCSVCDRDVFDLAEMTPAQVTAMLEARGEAPCVRMKRRADGTLVTADACPEPPRSRALAVAAVAAAATVVVAGGALVADEGRAHCTRPAQVPVTEHVEHESSRIMGMMADPIELDERTPPAPQPPWDRPDVVQAGFESLAHFTEPDEETR